MILSGHVSHTHESSLRRNQAFWSTRLASILNELLTCVIKEAANQDAFRKFHGCMLASKILDQNTGCSSLLKKYTADCASYRAFLRSLDFRMRPDIPRQVEGSSKRWEFANPNSFPNPVECRR